MSIWKVFVQPDDLSQSNGISCLGSPCASQQMYGLAIICQLMLKDNYATLYDMNEVWCLVESLLEAEACRVRVAAAILLLSSNSEDGIITPNEQV